MELYFEPYREIKDKVQLSEMTEFENAFLCGLLKEKRPKKILEVGVSAGGTSVVIMQCINTLELDCEMYSVDLSEYYYRDPQKKCGFLVDEVGIKIKGKRELITGHIIAECIEQIGSGIDFVILDTIHSCPGEILDFLTIAPFLTKDATVVLHDIGMHYDYSPQAFATQILLDTVTADSFVEEDFTRDGHYPNIGAFVCNNDTMKYIDHVFSALNISWSIIPENKHLDAYRVIFEKYYDDKRLVNKFDVAVKLNQKCHLRNQERILSGIIELNELVAWAKESGSVYIYGMGDRGKKIYKILERNKIQIRSFVVTRKEENDLFCEEINNMSFENTDKIIVATSRSAWESIISQLEKKNIKQYQVITENVNTLLGII